VRSETDPFLRPPREVDQLLAGAPWTRLAVLGDSLAEGIGEPTPGYPDESWVDQLATALRRQQPDLAVTNLGRRNVRCAQVLDEQLRPALDFGPDLASVVCGGNDMLVPDFDPDGVEATLDALVAPLRAGGAEVFLFSLQDLSAVWPDLAATPLPRRTAELNARTYAVAERHGALVVDMARHPARAERGMFSDDRLHASRRGHAVLTGATAEVLATRLR
jgi:lysophospholipase L1-like esterase